MKVGKIYRNKGTIYRDEFIGSYVNSPNGVFTLAWGNAPKDEGSESRLFALMQGDKVLLQRIVSLQLIEGRVSDTGGFVLRSISESTSQITAFTLEGDSCFSISMATPVIAFDLSPTGNCVLWVTESSAHCVQLSDKKEIACCRHHRLFYATAISVDVDRSTLWMRHLDIGWYAFSFDGSFTDREKWIADYMMAADGVGLFSLIRELKAELLPNGCSSAEEKETARNLALWTEEALRRGITDSFQLTQSDIYKFLCHLYILAEDMEAANNARQLAEDHLDGFRLIERTANRLARMTDPINSEEAHQLLDDLKRAEHTQRILDYPNFSSRLYRMRGELYEKLRLDGEAIAAYKIALTINPKVGCKKSLGRLVSNK